MQLSESSCSDGGQLAQRGCNRLGGLYQVGHQPVVDDEITLVLAAISNVVASREYPPDLRTEA